MVGEIPLRLRLPGWAFPLQNYASPARQTQAPPVTAHGAGWLATAPCFPLRSWLPSRPRELPDTLSPAKAESVG
jgi:hypothetical protein